MLNLESRVTVHSKLTAVPHTPVTPGKTHRLSVLDHAMGMHTLHIIFYYKEHNPLAADKYFDLGHLRQSLGDALSYYPPVTGRLQKDDCGNWQVKCNDAGVRILKAKVNCSFDEWLSSAEGFEEKDLVVWDEMPEDAKTWSPYRIQLNDFVGGGLAIGLSCPHMQADPTSATLLMKTWSEICRRSCISNPPLFHPSVPRANGNSSAGRNIIKIYEPKSGLKSPLKSEKMSTATFRFSNTIIKKCLVEINSMCPDATPFDLISGIFSSSIYNVKNTPRSTQFCNLSLGIDFRKNKHASLPNCFFGNALYFTTVSTDVNKMERGGWEYMTQMIHNHLSAKDEDEYWSFIDWLESKKDEDGKCAEPFVMYGSELACVNMEDVPAFAVVLDNMTPSHVSYHIGNVVGEGLILVLPSPEEGLGRTVMVTLPQDEIIKLCRDPKILELEPTMLVSGCEIQ